MLTKDPDNIRRHREEGLLHLEERNWYLEEAPTIALRLTGRARQIALSIPADELHDDIGIDKLFEKLDKSFRRDEVDCAYEAYKNFEICVRREGISITAYLLEFERLHEKAKTHKVELPDAILVYKLLENAARYTGTTNGAHGVSGAKVWIDEISNETYI